MVSRYSQRCPGQGDSCFLDAQGAEGSLGAGLALSCSEGLAVDVSSAFSDCCLCVEYSQATIILGRASVASWFPYVRQLMLECVRVFHYTTAITFWAAVMQAVC